MMTIDQVKKKRPLFEESGAKAFLTGPVAPHFNDNVTLIVPLLFESVGQIVFFGLTK
jgi:hypothetical protein